MVLYTTIINAVFSVLIATAFFFTASDAYLLNLLFYIIITPIITVTLNKIMFASENQMIVADALERIDGILDRQPLPETKDGRAVEDSSVTFENVSFRYENASKDALHQISLQIKDGEHVAFVGPSGGGKQLWQALPQGFLTRQKELSVSAAWMCVTSRQRNLWKKFPSFFRTVNFSKCPSTTTCVWAKKMQQERKSFRH